jgi:SNF2 family DNA or RNA helicase
VIEADRLVSSFKAAQNDLGNRRFNPENLKPIKHAVVRKQLVVRSNLDTVEYEELRGSWLHDSQAPARLPGTLKPEFPLKQHQLEGLRWLQHLWAHSPTACRGALLADDMGLGKTIQILAFIATCLEADPAADPFLIVAPVSLLENWKEEIDKFFALGALPDGDRQAAGPQLDRRGQDCSHHLRDAARSGVFPGPAKMVGNDLR